MYISPPVDYSAGINKSSLASLVNVQLGQVIFFVKMSRHSENPTKNCYPSVISRIVLQLEIIENYVLVCKVVFRAE
jgi:hypothetical protein